ncbi:MAG TPA: methyltransferase domain-containing protein [Phycisphaerae bacterium]|nr:methyltransferase domain-containing protein [Phycisphaerae bacterium]
MMADDQRESAFRDQYRDVASEGGLGRDSSVAGKTGDATRRQSYSQANLQGAPAGSVEMALGCGNPTAIAVLQPGEVVLDLGSGGGLDVFIAAKKVGPRGRAIGIDVTPEMVEKARQFATDGGYPNVEFRVAAMDSLPFPGDSIDVVISNCVINHATDKLAVFREAMRVLRPGGRMHVSDLVVEGEIPNADNPELKVWREWLAVACGKQEYLRAVTDAGFRQVDVQECHYAGPGMVPALEGKIASLQIRARK